MLKVKSFIFNPVEENTYVLYNEKDACCIIDPGCYFSIERKELQDFIEEQRLQPKFLLNTHCHLDHVFSNKFVHDQYGLPLQLHPKEQLVLEYAPAAGLQWGLPFENYQGPLIFLQEGTSIWLNNDELEILATPGHSPGSICFYCRSQQFVISGDVLCYQGIGRTDLPGGDPGTLLRSIREKLFTLPDEVVIYPGHGQPITVGFEKRTNPFLNE